MPEINNETIQFVKKRYQAAENVTKNDINKFSRFNRLYRNEQVDKNYTGMANLFIPEPHRIVTRKTAKIVNAIKSINVTAENESDRAKSKTAQVLLNFLQRKLSLKNFYRMWIKDSRIIGLSWARTTWRVDDETDKKPWRGFKVDLFSVDRIFVEPKRTLLDIFQGKLNYLIVEYEQDIETIEANKNYDKKVIGLMKNKGGNTIKETALSQSRQITIDSGNVIKDDVNKEHTIKEYWGKKDGKDMLIVIADDKWVLREDENPYADILDNPIPFVPMASSLEPHELFPMGDIEPNESLFNELNDTRNQRMDTVTLNIDPAKEVLRGANIKKKDLIAKRGWTIETDIPGGLRFIPPDMQGVRAAIDEEEIIRGDIQQSTGVLDFAQQSQVQQGVGIDTASGALVAKSESDVITEDELAIVKEGLRHFWRNLLALSQNFLDRKFAIRLTEDGVEQFFDVDKQSIQGNLDIDIDIETLQDKTTRQNLALMLFNQAKTVPGANLGKFFTDLLVTFKEDINIEEYYQPPQPQPDTPKISISLKGDLNSFQASEIYKTIPNVDPKMADPILSQEGRALMQGKLPEDQQAQANKDNAQAKKELAQADKLASETVKNLTS